MLKKIEQVKKDRGFKLFDIIIYGAIIVTVAVLFIVLFTTRDTSSLTGVKISVRAEVVFEYAFEGTDPEEKEIKCNDGTVVTISHDGDKGIVVTISHDGDKNEVYIDKDKKTVKMSDANCKGKHCMYFAPMDNNSDFIYCSPHGVKVEPLIQDLDSPNIKI